MAQPMASFVQTPILITGAKGFIGKNLAARLGALGCENLLLLDADSPAGTLEEYAARAAFVYHLAGVNRPQDPAEFYEGNSAFTARLAALLAQSPAPPPVVATSTAQVGNGSDYAKSKEEAEGHLRAYAERTGAEVFVFRLPGVFGKWSRPSYNTVVATFCHNIARGLPVEIRDPEFALPLVYIDDVVDHFIAALTGAKAADEAGPCRVTPEYTVTLGALAALLEGFAQSWGDLSLPDMADDFQRKLYATYLSFLPEDGFAYDLKMNRDDRGSFTEFLRTPDRGQVSVNITKPGVTKGNHWHDTKNEKFLVVAGQALIRFRRVGEAEVLEYRLAGERLSVVDIPTGYTHSIQNVGQEDLVTLMWASQPYDPENPDTYFEEV